MQRRRVHIPLPPELFDRLECLAERDERIVDQQAAYLLKRAILAEHDPADDVQSAETGPAP